MLKLKSVTIIRGDLNTVSFMNCTKKYEKFTNVQIFKMKICTFSLSPRCQVLPCQNLLAKPLINPTWSSSYGKSGFQVNDPYPKTQTSPSLSFSISSIDDKLVPIILYYVWLLYNFKTRGKNTVVFPSTTCLFWSSNVCLHQPWEQFSGFPQHVRH